MWVDRLVNSPTAHALELAARFNEARQQVLAENLANIDTPDYRTRRLDAAPFQSALRDALDEARSTGAQQLSLRDTQQMRVAPGGSPRFRPTLEPAENILFHDGTNARLEKLMTDVNENALSYELATNLLRGRYETLLRAIRGRVT